MINPQTTTINNDTTLASTTKAVNLPKLFGMTRTSGYKVATHINNAALTAIDEKNTPAVALCHLQSRKSIVLNTAKMGVFTFVAAVALSTPFATKIKPQNLKYSAIIFGTSGILAGTNYISSSKNTDTFFDTSRYLHSNIPEYKLKQIKDMKLSFYKNNECLKKIYTILNNNDISDTKLISPEIDKSLKNISDGINLPFKKEVDSIENLYFRGIAKKDNTMIADSRLSIMKEYSYNQNKIHSIYATVASYIASCTIWGFSSFFLGFPPEMQNIFIKKVVLFPFLAACALGLSINYKNNLLYSKIANSSDKDDLKYNPALLNVDNKPALDCPPNNEESLTTHKNNKE